MSRTFLTLDLNIPYCLKQCNRGVYEIAALYCRPFRYLVAMSMAWEFNL